ncbi:hypothetical protein ACFE04_018528 [Oxalis oulophora]
MSKPEQQQHPNEDLEKIQLKSTPKRKRCMIAFGFIAVLLLLLFIIALILAFTVFKPKQPKTDILSASVSGVAPRISFPAINFQLNLTLDLQILVYNPNHASFKHGYGKSYIFYQSTQVGDADLYPGLTPAMGNETLPARLTLQLDKIVSSNMSGLISDVMGGEIELQTDARIPGRVTFLGFIKKHVVATSKCQLFVGIPAMKVLNQTCKSKTHL